MKTFLWIFILALLFVIGSAGAMRYLDRQIPKHKPRQERDEEHDS